jgi:phosphatidylserine/phosphatidylglycerophosphate/cardiolipin synthase-like enzyme
VVQPGDGIAPLLRGIERAKRTVEIVIFRFDRGEIERALEDAAKRGVFVHALIAHANRSGEKNLRKLETRLLARGITVARTADDLARYHGKMMIIDRKELYLLAFNFTYRDIEHSRSFALIIRNRSLVQEAAKLFEADIRRQHYTPGSDRLLVSPLNARKHLASFLRGARQELLIYDLKIRDRAMVRLLEERARAGVDVRIIGTIPRGSARLAARQLPRLRLHTRTIIRDRRNVFLGSQSLRELELDGRREIGVILKDAKVVNSLVRIFEEDWASTGASKAAALKEQASVPAARAAKRIAKAVAKDLPPVAPVVEQVVKEMAGKTAGVELDGAEVEETVKDAVKTAVKEAVRGMVADAVEQNHREPGAPK